MMARGVVGLVAVSVAVAAGGVCGGEEIDAGGFQARFEHGALVGLQDTAGNVFVAATEPTKGAAVHHIEGDRWAASIQQSAGEPDARVENAYAVDAASGDLVVTQHAESAEKGLWGVEWSIERIPLDMNIVVPAHSGLKLTRTTPGASYTFDYPHAWEAQLVIVEGAGRGFYVWAEDAAGVFKRLTLERRQEGWRLGFITMAYAPFEARSACDSVRWRVNVYEGDWRVPARRYRDWAEQAFGPTQVAEQDPAWVRDIRACVIMGLNIEVLEALPARLDPKQTILYVPSWRKAGYDRDYPTYDAPFETLDPFTTRAHELGFRVMLHVNYFGCDPLNPLYAQFEPYQCRSPWGSHEKDWWLWDRAEPPIKFAYINPAHKPWRDLFVSRMVELCSTCSVDALHLDQTLCIYNDHNGLIDGMSMIDGNVALHRALREALPEVALSGEGLDEVTYRHEAFAQRHAFGINHSEGTFSAAHLKAAHPISSYLLRPYTCMYGYLGCAPPTSGQLYSAWAEVYRHMGVIPTLKPNLAQLSNPTGFSKQFFEEAAFWLDQRVDVDVDAPWPAQVAFPFATATGERVVQTVDRRLLWGDREVSRTISGVAEVRAPGSIPGWHAYDEERIIGLDPGHWYPYSSTPRDLDALHVAALPESFTLDALAVHEDLAFVRTRAASSASIRLAGLIHDAACGSRPFEGQGTEVRGDLGAPDGASFVGTGDALHAHPPFRVAGTGVVYARFALRLPENAVGFISDVAMDDRAVGEDKTDGVTYGVRVQCGEREEHKELHNATSERRPLTMDLAPFAGKEVTLELTVHPGPQRNPSFDWARWYAPRIECDAATVADVTLAGVGPWSLALAGRDVFPLQGDKDGHTLHVPFPGAVYLLPSMPASPMLPLAIASASYRTTFVSDTGVVLDAPPHACAQPGESAVDGVTRAGIFAHPPDHGRTIVDIPMVLPGDPAAFHSFVGIRDRAKSAGVEFVVEANGGTLAREKVLPGAWHEVACDLTPWAGKPVVLSLITDSAGDYICDWAQWGELQIAAK